MDIYGALLTGAAVYLFDVKAEGISRLADWLKEEQITVYHSVPTLFRHFARSLDNPQQFPTLRLFDLGGEPVDARDIELLRTHFVPPCVLVNHMAFTEASVAAQFFVDHDSEIATSIVPVGYPAEGIDILLTDEDGHEVEPGEIGEIRVRSSYISPGYWQKPELTKASFSTSPGPGMSDATRLAIWGGIALMARSNITDARTCGSRFAATLLRLRRSKWLS